MHKMPIAAIVAAALAFHSPAPAESVKVNGIELYYDVQGSGEPLLILHGFGECGDMDRRSRRNWRSATG